MASQVMLICLYPYLSFKRFVVDPGIVKARGYNAKLGVDSLLNTPVSQAQARQRSGRAGARRTIKSGILIFRSPFSRRLDSLRRTFITLTLLPLLASPPSGREAPGKAFRLYTESTFDELTPTTLPEIQRSNLRSVMLQLKAMGIDDVLNFDFLDPPPRDAVLRSLLMLLSLGALDSKGQLTESGK